VRATCPHHAKEISGADLSALQYDFEPIAAWQLREGAAERRAGGHARDDTQRADAQCTGHLAGTVATGNNDTPDFDAIEKASHHLRERRTDTSRSIAATQSGFRGARVESGFGGSSDLRR